METSFVPVLFGADINVYSMARAFHEAYGIKTVAYGMYPSGVCYGSGIIDYRVRPNNDDPAVVLRNVEEAAREFHDKTLLVLGCGDNYLTSISANLSRYPQNVIAPYIGLEQMETLIHKERFYALCDQYGIDHPATFVYHKGMGHDFTLPFDGPFVVKPAESATYWDHPFDTQKKAYVLQTRQEVDRVIDEIYDHGYEDSLILQDFIPGDDTNMRVLTCYSDGATSCWRSIPATALATMPSSSPRRNPACVRRSGAFWRTFTLWASPTLTSNTTPGTTNSRPLRSTAARGGATTMSPARGTTWPSCWWRTGSNTAPSRW